MATNSWNVPIVKLNEKELVVDLGGRGEHLVNLVDLLNNIKIKKTSDSSFDKSVIETLSKMDEHDVFVNNVNDAIKKKELVCSIPFMINNPSKGGRHTKVRRPRRHRVTHRVIYR